MSLLRSLINIVFILDVFHCCPMSLILQAPKSLQTTLLFTEPRPRAKILHKEEQSI